MVHSDDRGLVLPPRIAPRQVAIIPIGKDDKVFDLSNDIKGALLNNNITAYVDDSDKSPGFKFAEAEVNGIPVRIEVGARDLAENKITFARRDTGEKIQVSLDGLDVVTYTKELLETIQHDMYERAKERRDKLTFEAHNMEDMNNILNNQPGFIHAMWCGDPECEAKIKEIKGCKSRCIIPDGERIDDKCVCCGKEAKHHVIWGIQY
jgi:prolyl-tRNA synthetase